MNLITYLVGLNVSIIFSTAVSASVGLVDTWGHSSNSHEGGMRPTALPSGHIFASIVHATPLSGEIIGAIGELLSRAWYCMPNTNPKKGNKINKKRATIFENVVTVVNCLERAIMHSIVPQCLLQDNAQWDSSLLQSTHYR